MRGVPKFFFVRSLDLSSCNALQLPLIPLATYLVDRQPISFPSNPSTQLDPCPGFYASSTTTSFLRYVPMYVPLIVTIEYAKKSKQLKYPSPPHSPRHVSLSQYKKFPSQPHSSYSISQYLYPHPRSPLPIAYPHRRYRVHMPPLPQKCLP